MRWGVWDRKVGGCAGVVALAIVLVSYPCTDRGSTAAADIRPGMTREQVANRLGTDGRDDPDAAPGVAYSIDPKNPPGPGAVHQYMAGLATLFATKRTYTGLFFTLNVSYSLGGVTSASVQDPSWNPKTWPGALVGLLAVGCAAGGAAELSRRLRLWADVPYPPADRCS